MRVATLKNIAIALLKLNVAILAFYFVFRKLDIDKLLWHLKDANLFLLVLAVIISNVSLMVSGIRSNYYLKEYGLKLSKKFCLALYYLGTFFNIILPGGISGDGYKVYLLWKLENFSKVKALRIMLYERTNGFFILLCFGLFLLLISDYMDKIPYIGLLTWIAIIFIIPSYLFGVKYILRDKIKVAWNAAYYSFLVQFFQMVMIILVIFALVDNPDFKTIVNFSVLFVIASIVAIIPVSVGGAGLRELTFLYGVKLLGTGYEETGVAIALLTFIIYVITSLPGTFFIYNINRIKR